MHIVQIHNLTRALPHPISANYCDSFWSRFRGFMLHAPIGEHEGAVLVNERDSQLDAAIHMLFMNFDIAVIWINSKHEVSDVKLARKWQPMLVPARAAQFVLETHVANYDLFQVGDLVEFTNA